MKQQFLCSLLAIIVVSISTSCSDNEPDDNSITQNEQQNSVQPSVSSSGLDIVFPKWLMQNFNGNNYSYDAATTRVSRIQGNMATCTLTYSDNTVEANDTYGRSWIFHLSSNGFADRIEYYLSDGMHETYALTYSSDGYLTTFSRIRNGVLYEKSNLTWSNGDITGVKTEYSGGYSLCTFDYTIQTNIGGFMMYNTQCCIDADDMELFYFCGFLGKPTAHLIKAFSATEYEDGSIYRFKSTFDYAFDSNGLPSKMVQTETEDDDGTYTEQSDFIWKQRDF